MASIEKLPSCDSVYSPNPVRRIEVCSGRHFACKIIPYASALILLSALLCSHAFAQQDVATIIQKSVEANRRDWNAAPEYDYQERDRDGQGSKTYDVTTVLGSPYERLIAINGKGLNAAQKAEQQKKYEQMLSQRKAESPDQRSRRIAKFQADRRRDHEMLEQLTKAFDFRLESEQKIGARDVYVLKATPRHGYQPPNRDTEVLPGMEGRLWIDKTSYQWVKVEAHVTRPVSIEGFLAQVEPGTRFELEKMPVDDDIWLATHYSMSASAKVLYVVPHHSRDDETYFNYHKSQSPSDASSLHSSRKDQYADSRRANP